jgi:hypothetical protein
MIKLANLIPFRLPCKWAAFGLKFGPVPDETTTVSTGSTVLEGWAAFTNLQSFYIYFLGYYHISIFLFNLNKFLYDFLRYNYTFNAAFT